MAGLAKKLVAVCGPTATGKTELALALCRRFSGELVGADSMQIYAGLPVGTVALTAEDAPEVKRHLTGFLPPEQSYSVARYVDEAKEVIAGIHARGALPVLCGGTGLYIQSLVEGVAFTKEPPPEALRAELRRRWETLGGEVMLAELAEKDPAHAARLSPKDRQRILRSLEEFTLTCKSYDERAQESRAGAPPYNALLLGLNFPDRQQLYARINARVDTMLQKGLLEEARRVYDNREHWPGAAQAIGYKEFFPYFEGERTPEACAEHLKQATRRYAKRQLTWFSGMGAVHWLDAGAEDLTRQAEEMVAQWLQT